MPDLHFQVEEVLATPNAAVPQLSFKVRITNTELEPVHSIALRAQIQIEPVRRRYTPAEQEHLKELFGEPERWSKSVHPLLWTNANVNVTGFTGTTVIDVPVPCTFDFNVAITKYIYGLEGGELPVWLMFSGTVFHAGQMGLQIAQIPWDREAAYKLPVRVWKEMMDQHYPNTAWLCLQRDVFDRIAEYKARNNLATWEQALERALGLTAEAKA
ncbi:MAG TPA: DUF6084 family protein [Terriglobales bacterium]|nr:DUF6084 family protein [Terriglobales bacterium]